MAEEKKMSEKDLIAIERIEKEINRIKENKNFIYFFVIDSGGSPSGSLEYVYKLAYILKENGYNVAMLYQKEEEFIGVDSWLGEKYSNLPHYDISDEEVSVSPSDVLFIPEIFANVMMQSRKLPCKRIAILQNYDYVLEQMPVSAQWGDLGIMEAITNTDANGELLKEIFPYVKTTTIHPYVDEMFVPTTRPKKMVINLITKDQKTINRVIKPFYWKYPLYKWVTFRHLHGFPKETFAEMLREGAVTIWEDDDTHFGYSALEAMQSGSLVIAKTPDNMQEWMEKDGLLRDCCVWFDDYNKLHKIIASVVKSWVSNNIPSEIEESVNETLSLYSKDKTTNEIVEYVKCVIEKREKELISMASAIKNQTKK